MLGVSWNAQLKCVWVIAALIGSAWSLASGNNLRLTRFGIEEGLSQSSVLSMVQDQMGFVWMATQDGLNRFDGYTFRVFRPEDDNPQSLSDNFIRCLFLDSKGRLWVGTRGGGLNLYDADHETFTQYLPLGSEGTLARLDVLVMAGVGEDTLWVGTGRGLYKVNIVNEEFSQVSSDPLAKAEILALEKNDDGLWVGTAQGLFRFDPLENRAVKVDGPEPGGVRGLLTDPLGKLWVVAANGLFHKPDENNVLIPHASFKAEQIGAELSAIFMDAQGYLWIGSSGKGLFSFPFDKTYQVSNHTKRLEDKSSLPDDWIHSLMGDRTGGLWVGTGDGFGIVDLTGAAFKSFWHEVEDADSLSHNQVQAVAEDDRGNLWVGTRGGGLNYTDRNQPGSFEKIRMNLDVSTGLGTDNVRALTYDPRGFLWVGSDGAGLFKMNLDQVGVFRNFQPDPDNLHSLSHLTIRVLHVDELGNLWVGTHGGGLNRMASAHAVSGKNHFTHLRHESNSTSLSHDIVRAFAEDPSRPGKVFWVGTQGGGLNRMELFDSNNGEHSTIFKAYLTEAGPGRGPSHNVITSICWGASGQLWLGTPNGLNRFDIASERFHVFKDGLANTVVYAVQRDDANYLWMSTNQGLARFDPWTHQFKGYDVQDGLPGNEFNAGASFRATLDGKLYFGSMDGFSCFYGDRIKGNLQPPTVVLTDLLLFNQPVTPGISFKAMMGSAPREAPLTKSISRTSTITLKHDDTITLGFSGLHFASPSSNQYAYILENLNSDWISTNSANRLATYTNLSPGSYTFRVKASNKDGVWNEQDCKLGIIIPSPLWASWWAYMIYGMTFVGLLWLVVRAERMKLVQERSLVEKLKQVDSLKDEFLANTSHELRTPLNGMIGLAESLLEGGTSKLDEDTRNTLEVITASGRRLAELVNNILDFSKMRNHILELDFRAVDLHTLVDVVLALTRPLVRNKELTLLNQVPANLPSVEANENRLQQILHNLVGNAVKFTHSGQVTVSAELKGDRAFVHVEDTGIGIEKEHINRIFDSFVQVDGAMARSYGGTGLGLAITRSLVEQHGSEISVNSTVGKGSCFSFSLKLAEGSDEESPGRRESVASVVALDTLNPADLVHSQISKEVSLSGEKFGNEWHVLIVDDEAVNRLVLFNHLSPLNFKLTEASNGAEALEKLEQDPSIDLLLLDIMMPKLSGYEVCRFLRRTRDSSNLPVIFLSARNQVKDIAAGFHAGGNDYLSKPFSREELMVRITHHLSLLGANRLVIEQREELAEVNEILITTRQQLVVKEKMLSLGMLTAGISHEINNPASYAHGSMQNLTVELEGFRQFLFEVAGDEADSEILSSIQERFDVLTKHVNLAREGTSRIRGIVMDLNTFSSGERGFERVALTSCLQTTLNLVKANFKESVTFECDFQDALDIVCKPAEMNQVFMNMIMTACHSIQAKLGANPLVKGVLRIETRRDGEEALIVFKDNGQGISQEDHNKVFDIFYAAKARGEGSGQGFAISKSIIHGHKGRVVVDAREGEGVTYSIFLPFTQEENGGG